MKKKITYYIGGVLCLLLIQVVFAMICNSLGIQGTSSSKNRLEEMISNPFILIITLVISPIIEELIFRFLLFKKIWIKPFSIYSALFSSILFGLIHGQSNIMTIPLILNGLLYCFLYKRTNTLWLVILTHSSFNACVLLILFLNR